MDKNFDHRHQRGSRKPPAEPHTSASAQPLILPNPYTSDQISRGQSGLSPKPAGRGGDAPRSHGYSSSRPVREASDNVLQSNRTKQDPQAKMPQNKKDSQGKFMGKTSVDMQKKGFKATRSAPTSAGKPKPAQTNSVPFEVKMADFPELGGVSVAKAAPPVQKECWGPPKLTSSQTPKLASSWMSGSRGSPTLPGPQVCATNAKPESQVIQAVQPVVTSWANIASQPPKKLDPNDKTISCNSMQIESMAAQEEEIAPGRKKRKKKKKAKSSSEGAGGDSSEPVISQEPPKFEDEEEFPDLTLALSKTERLITSSNTKLCNEENQREGSQHQSADQNQVKSPAAKTQPTETGKKGQKSEKASGKKSKVPMQLDIGNMLATLEKKQQSQKAKQDAKPVILTVGGGLPVVQKQTSAQKKPLWQQDKIAHNPLDSTSPLVKKGKQREVPKAKKPTPLKKVILKEREERKQRRLLEERGLLPESEYKLASNCTEKEQCDANATDEADSPAEALDELNDTCQIMGEAEETDKNETETIQQQIPSPQSYPAPKIHSRKFRDYCSQMLSKDVDECVMLLLKELVRFQDRLYQKDPMKARMKRRIVMGLREVHKHLKLRKIKCVIISPNCERIQSKGGLDEALHTIIDTCREQGVPFIFALSRKALGRCVNKAVPVTLVGIFNYDGAQDYYHKMIELSSEARAAYEGMVSSVEQRDQAEAELETNTEEPVPDPDVTEPEEPQYIKIWKKMLEEEYNHTLMDFEVELRSMHLDNECTENTDDEES
ncbi:selenocysteine insertion sequence-binding protein 2-like isoform X2 [Neolamprologus brichardi]|uniref:selenocysteine insertion sequence-binding protein 2-like isoform X2 n=1 Tax=Neolamprologus brichardi TaxID=32507 RepID=UPI0003EC1611|nr:selenocysteine insertion sequence-binding protein 2-like isoform X2 [Neolamprologus brichardi]